MVKRKLDHVINDFQIRDLVLIGDDPYHIIYMGMLELINFICPILIE